MSESSKPYTKPSMNNLAWPSIVVFDEGHFQKLFSTPFILQEKIDGSQLSFYLDETNVLKYFNRGNEVHKSHKSFGPTITLLNKCVNKIKPGYIYHGEALAGDRGKNPDKTVFISNVNEYYREPANKFVLFALTNSSGASEDFASVANNAVEIGVEPTHIIAEFTGSKFVIYKNGKIIKEIETDSLPKDYDSIIALFDSICATTTSYLSTENKMAKIEGFVIKSFITNKIKQYKFVSSEFKEAHKFSLATHKKMMTCVVNNDFDSFIKLAGSHYSTKARLDKAKQRLGIKLNIDTVDVNNNIAHKSGLIADLDEDFLKESYTDYIKMLKKYFPTLDYENNDLVHKIFISTRQYSL